MRFVFCQGGREGTWRSQMAYLFPQETPRFSRAPSQLRAGRDSTVSGRDSSNATVPERTPPSSSRICTFLLCCQSRDFSARHSIFVDVRKGVEKEGWEKATHFIYGLCSDPSFHYFNPTEIRNHNPWMKRHWTNSVKPWAPWGCMFFPYFWFLRFLPCCRFLTSTFEKPSSLTGQAQGTYLYAAQISESVLSLCRVKNGLHFLDSPCGCKE